MFVSNSQSLHQPWPWHLNVQWYPSRRDLERGSGRRIEGSGLKEVVVYHFLHYILHLYIDIRYVLGSGSQFLTTSLIIFLTTSFTIFRTTSHLISFVWCPLIICLNLWKQDPFSIPQTTFSLPPSSKQILNGAWHYSNQNCNIFVSPACKVQAIRLSWCHIGKFFLKVHFLLILSLSSGYLWLNLNMVSSNIFVQIYVSNSLFYFPNDIVSPTKKNTKWSLTLLEKNLSNICEPCKV